MMAVRLPAFTQLEDSLFLTLYARALDSRRPRPILGDATADQVVRTIDYQYDKLDIKTNLILNVSLRAKKLDQVASDFLTRHPDAVGLNLGAGARHPIRASGTPGHRGLVRRRLPRCCHRSPAPDPRAPQRPCHRRRRAGPGLAGRPPDRPARHHCCRRHVGVPLSR